MAEATKNVMSEAIPNQIFGELKIIALVWSRCAGEDKLIGPACFMPFPSRTFPSGLAITITRIMR